MKNYLAVLLALLVSACASLNPIAKPEVAITHLALGESRGFQQSLNVGLQLNNPNAFDINLGRLRYQISLAGKSLAGGSFNQEVLLAANGKTNITVPVELNLLNGLGLVSSLLD